MIDSKLYLLIVLFAFTVSCSNDDATIATAPILQEPEPPSTVIVTGTLSLSLNHKGLKRSYILYVPEDYDGTKEVPLVFNFHGYTSNAMEQMQYGDFRDIAKREGFIIAHPEGLKFNGSTHWNVGGWTLGSTADDIGFTEAMIQEISSNYNIDQKRIYSTGMSNGGFFSFELACQLSHKIAAVASVTGSMTPETLADCNPSQLVPILQFHGTNDVVVPYAGTTWTEHIDNVIDYWVAANELEDISMTTLVDDIDETDGSTLERFQYGEVTDASTVIHYKVIGGSHTWPGTSIRSSGTNYDINASELIWAFFDSYDLEGKREL